MIHHERVPTVSQTPLIAKHSMAGVMYFPTTLILPRFPAVGPWPSQVERYPREQPVTVGWLRGFGTLRIRRCSMTSVLVDA